MNFLKFDDLKTNMGICFALGLVIIAVPLLRFLEAVNAFIRLRKIQKEGIQERQ